ncbi:MAG: carboxypeptidase regulatory-like domain-containing protein [Planctomycetes bacterium]|nr:carboxypeptidase regulatory-like domain-containing protein [Planctomycetota bacterium]MCB9911063.1 carboxypeptidase regulatory-like domain-containing protein [Planctomycetota bacterium]MCB9911470.1 carboxypeptidase regulatory-like domain-containing protein [Planctomycetota bacterium]
MPRLVWIAGWTGLLVLLGIGSWRWSQPHPALQALSEEPAAIEPSRPAALVAGDVPMVEAPSSGERSAALAPTLQDASQAPARLAGTVRNLLGQPLSGVSLVWIPMTDHGPDPSWTDRPACRAVSDAQGQFAFGAVPEGQLQWEDPDSLPVYIPVPTRNDRGEWNAWDLVGTGVATLVVEKLDGLGQPAGATSVGLRVAELERWGRGLQQDLGAGILRQKRTTDGEGRAIFERVPARQRMEVALEGVTYDRFANDGSLRESLDGGALLCLEPGERRTVWQQDSWLDGDFLVQESDGTPAVGAVVEIYEHLPQPWRKPRLFGGGSCDEAGRFALRGSIRVPTANLQMVVRGRNGAPPSYSPFGGMKWPDPLHAAWRTLAKDDLGHVSVVLEPTWTWAGRVIDEQGQPVQARLRLQPLEGDWHPDLLPSGMPKEQRTDEAGAFRWLGVPNGRFQLEVWATGGQFLRFENLQPDGSPLEIVLPTTLRARIRIRVEGEPGLQGVAILCTRLLPDGEELPRFPELISGAIANDLRGWPVEAPEHWYDRGAYRGPFGHADFAAQPIQGLQHEFEVEPGTYWLAATAYTADRTACYPVGTTPVEVGPGSYELTIPLRPGGSLYGIVPDWTPGSDWVVALFASDGAPLGIYDDSSRRSLDLPIASDGAFWIARAPVGRFELRAGPRAAVLAGTAPWRSSVEVTERGDHKVVLGR